MNQEGGPQPGNPGFVPWPLSALYGGAPWQYRQGGDGTAPLGALENYVPPRVRQAMEYVQLMMLKQRTGAAVNDISIEIIDPQRLTTAEANALASAANLLVDYFNGKVELDASEKQRKAAAQKLLEGMDRQAAEEGGGIKMNCPVCAGRSYPSTKCRACAGRGAVFMRPLTVEEAAGNG